jgi:DNA-binding transcriptional MerR regulator
MKQVDATQLYSIGEVAKHAGVSVQTLRHYHKLGLLSPSEVSEAGYRFYSALDCMRLDLIRTLREVGFDLETIALLLKDKENPRAAVMMQLGALETQSRALQRQQLLLRTVARGEESAILSRLQRLNVLAKLDKLEREAFLAEQLGWIPSEDTKQSREVWEAAVLNLPEDLDEGQLELWLELAEIAADESFQQTLQRQWQMLADFSEAERLEWSRLFQQTMTKAMQAIKHKQSVTESESRAVIDAWLQGGASLFKQPPEPDFLQWLYQQFTTTYDPRIERYWQLVTALKGQEYSPIYGQAYQWLLEGLRLRLEDETR